MKTKVDILICAFNDSIYEVEKILMEPVDWLQYIISHQITNETYGVPEALKERTDVKIYKTESKGLSKNRNNILSKSTADVCFIADDDVRYDIESIKSVISVFEKNKDLDVFIGKIKTYKGEPDYKMYPEQKVHINFFNASKISSIEIAFRNNVFFKKQYIQFDENFGLAGNKYPEGGEELIFITDCLKKKLKIVYYPLFMVKHPYESSGKKKLLGKNLFLYHCALTRRIFGYPINILVMFVKIFQNKDRYKLSVQQALYLLLFNKKK